MKGSSFVGGGFIALCTVAFLATGATETACTNDACVGDVIEYGNHPNEGRVISSGRWETTGISESWLVFGPQRRFIFRPTGLEGREFLVPTVYVSASDSAEKSFQNFTLASGNLAEIAVYPDHFEVHNNTCATYFLRVEMDTLAPPIDAGPDSGPETVLPGDAGPQDAAPDVGADQ